MLQWENHFQLEKSTLKPFNCNYCGHPILRAELLKAGQAGSPNFAERLAHLNEMFRQATNLARNYRSGRFARASGEEPRPPATIDTHGFKKLISRYHKSEARKTALELFGVGTFAYKPLCIKKESHVKTLLACEFYFQAAGCRLVQARFSQIKRYRPNLNSACKNTLHKLIFN